MDHKSQMDAETPSDIDLKDDLLATKLEIPLIGSRIVRRHRLTDILRAGMERRLTLLVAPTGYGKTTLLAEWLSEILQPDWRVVWVTIDSFDNETFRLWTYIASAIKRIYPRLRLDRQRLMKDRLGESRLTALTPLLNAITQIPHQIILVLDDYQWITNESVHEEIRYLLEHQPKNLHLLIASRVPPPIPFSRLRAQRQLVEISARDLSFTLQEATNFFSFVMEVKVDQDQAASLLRATEGWIAGLQLITLSIQGKSGSQSFLERLPVENQQIFEYLMEEVLDQQEPELRDFLLKTSLLSEFCPSLCDAILGRNDSSEILNRVVKANLFIVPRDEQRRWYSYHPLFADTLQKFIQENDANAIPEIHRRASIWLEENGYPDKAVQHALVYGDVERAARIIDACALQAVLRFDLVHLAMWISKFSDDLIRKRLQLGIYYALASYLVERFEKVEPKLQALERNMDDLRQNGEIVENENLIRWEITALRAALQYWRGNTGEAPASIIAVMQEPPINDAYFYGFMFHCLAEVFSSQGDLASSLEAYQKGCDFAIEHGLVREYTYSQSELIYVYKTIGRLSDAAMDCEKLLSHAEQWDLSVDVMAFARSGLAEIALEKGQFNLAAQHVELVIENFNQIEDSPLGWTRHEWILIRLARYYLAVNDRQNGLNFFERAMAGFSANRKVVHYLSAQLIDLQTQVLVMMGNFGGQQRKFEEQLEYLDPLEKAIPARRLALARYILAEGDPQAALALLDQLIPDLQVWGMIEMLLDAWILKSMAGQQMGDHTAAVLCLHHALRLAIPEEYHLPFAKPGQHVAEILAYYLKNPMDANEDKSTPEMEYAAELLTWLSNGPADLAHEALPHSIRPTTELVYPLFDPLSNRELEILKLIIDGKSTKEIASNLVVSINTARVHIKSLYRKTGVHTREALVQRAIELGIVKPD